jgi:hypothetical protein
MPIMVGMMVCAVVVVCAAEAHKLDSRVKCLIPDQVAECQCVSASLTRCLLLFAFVTACSAAVELSSPSAGALVADCNFQAASDTRQSSDL